MLDPAEKFEREGERGINWRDESDRWKKRSAMHLRRYYEVASALGFYPAETHFTHAALIERAKELARFARCA